MAITLQLFSYTKKVDSTAYPPLNSGTTFTGGLKSPCSILNPRIEFNLNYSPSHLNYAYIESFGRWYWIRNWTWEAGLWVAEMEVDVLATYKSDIGDSQQYVVRAQSAMNGNIVDSLYPSTTDYSYQVVNITDYPFITTGLGNATYMLGVIGSYPDSAGSVEYYAMTPEQFGDFNNYLMSGIDWAGIDFADIEGMTEPLLKTLFNPYQYVVSCKWFPLSPQDIVPGGPGTDSVRYGWWNLNDVKGQRLPLAIRKISKSFSAIIPKHPQQTRGGYLNSSPYRRIFLVWPPIGVVEIPTSYFMGNHNVLQADIIIDPISGQGQLYINNYDISSAECVNFSFNMAANIPVSQMGYDSTFTTVASLIGGVGNALESLGGFGETVGGFINAGVQTAAAFTPPEMHTVGKSDGTAFLATAPVIYVQFQNIVDEDLEHNGRPLCAKRQLLTIPGYIKCMNADVNMTGTAEEKEQVNAYLNGGFHYE